MKIHITLPDDREYLDELVTGLRAVVDTDLLLGCPHFVARMFAANMAENVRVKLMRTHRAAEVIVQPVIVDARRPAV